MHLHSKILTHLSIILGLAILASTSSFAEDSSNSSLYPKITIPKEAGEQCVRPPAEIRRLHPDMLKHDRIQTMRKGVRANSDGSKLEGSLKACISCHATKDDSGYVRIDNEQHFCVSCHKFAAVTIDCFQCHRDIPEESGDKGKAHAHNTDFFHQSKDLAVISSEVSSNDSK